MESTTEQKTSFDTSQKLIDSVLDFNKNNVGSFEFLATSGEQNQNSYFCNDFVGLPSVPLIGQYGKNGYEMNDVKFLSVHECICGEGKIFSSSTTEEITLPTTLKDLLLNIPEIIPTNKPISNDGEEDGSKKPNNSRNPKPVNTQPKTHIPDFHPFQFMPTVAFNFSWSISFQDRNINSKIRPMPMNLVLHPFIYPVIDLSQKKRIFTNVPVAMVAATQNPGVKIWEKDYKNVQFDEFRSEYLSVHMRGPALCFSPNNLKFEMDPEAEISHFFTIILTIDGFYMVTYHWNVNNPNLFKPLSKIFQQSNNTKEAISMMSDYLGDKSPYIQTIQDIFQQALTPISKEQHENKSDNLQQDGENLKETQLNVEEQQKNEQNLENAPKNEMEVENQINE